MVKVITAPDRNSRSNFIEVFLAGGITGCTNWQNMVIKKLNELSVIFDLSDVVILNPRREDFDTNDRNAEIEQIKWEHASLEECDLFTVFFEASTSLQPITLYELGKWGTKKPSVITVQSGYLRERDVLIQTALDELYAAHIYGEDAIEHHARTIGSAIQEVRNKL